MIQHEEKINKNIKNQRTNKRVGERRESIHPSRNTRRQAMKIKKDCN